MVILTLRNLDMQWGPRTVMAIETVQKAKRRLHLGNSGH